MCGNLQLAIGSHSIPHTRSMPLKCYALQLPRKDICPKYRHVVASLETCFADQSLLMNGGKDMSCAADEADHGIQTEGQPKLTTRPPLMSPSHLEAIHRKKVVHL